MTNQSLGGGNEGNGRPLLGGVGGAVMDSTSARQSGSLPFVGALEAFARVASSVASGFGGLGSYSSSLQDAIARDPSNPGGQER